MPFKKGHIRTGGIKKGQKQERTLIKERFNKAINKSLYEQSAEAVDRNMHEFLNSKNRQERLIATKYFSKFFRAEKKETTFEGIIHLTEQEIADKTAERLGITK